MTRLRRCTCNTEIHAKGGPSDCTTCRKLAKRRAKIKATKARNKPDTDARGFKEERIPYVDWRG